MVLRVQPEVFRAGERVAVAVSGGADSVALLLAMAEAGAELGLVLSAVHVHHGLRGAEADADAEFVAALASRLAVPLRVERGDVRSLAVERGQGIEEAARALRTRVFEAMLRDRAADTIATAHTLDDQAETVLMKLLRGAWTEGLGGISPELPVAGGGRIVRPWLQVSRAEILAFLEAHEQPWREDSTNQELDYSRNRIRHTVLPQLREFAPQVAAQLARLSTVARDEEAWWTRELARVLPGLVLPGRPVRGGGRANSTQPGETTVALETERLRQLHPALQRRVLRAAAAQLGAEIGFDHTETLLTLAASAERSSGKRGRVDLGGGVAAERSARELRISRRVEPPAGRPEARVVPVPGMLEAREYGVRIVAAGALEPGEALCLRRPEPGDRLRLRHAAGEKSVKDVLERRGLTAAARAELPVLAIGRRIVWMEAVEIEAERDLTVVVERLLPAEGMAARSFPSVEPR